MSTSHLVRTRTCFLQHLAQCYDLGSEGFSSLQPEICTYMYQNDKTVILYKLKSHLLPHLVDNDPLGVEAGDELTFLRVLVPGHHLQSYTLSSLCPRPSPAKVILCHLLTEISCLTWVMHCFYVFWMLKRSIQRSHYMWMTEIFWLDDETEIFLDQSHLVPNILKDLLTPRKSCPICSTLLWVW